MQIAATASVGAVGDDPILFRGAFEQTIPQMAKLGYKAAELHIYDSDQIDRENVYKLLDENHVTLTSIGTGSAYEQDGICLGSCDPEKRRLAIKRLEGHMKTAYGSNLSMAQMAQRCPDAIYVGTAEIKDYQLLFKGSQSGSYLTVEPKKGSTVPVLVWRISERDEHYLDRYEGYPSFYYKKTMEVEVLFLKISVNRHGKRERTGKRFMRENQY